MSETSARQLITPARRRGWGEILQLMPLTTSPDVALAVKRSGRTVSIIPAGSQIYLSDYLDWPSEIREIDMRERILALQLIAPSRDAGRSFVVRLRIAYRVVSPARVAAAPDPAGQLEHGVSARTTTLAGTLGHDQAAVLHQVLAALFGEDEELREELSSIGLQLGRAGIAVAPGA